MTVLEPSFWACRWLYLRYRRRITIHLEFHPALAMHAFIPRRFIHGPNASNATGITGLQQIMGRLKHAVQGVIGIHRQPQHAW